jgi:hypothetical protein
MAGKRFRLKFMFWLDMNKSDEAELAEEIESLKEQRLFTETLRDGIRLICDLRAGRTDRLFAMFPWLTAEIERRARAENMAIQQDLDRLWGAIASQSVANGSRPSLQSFSSRNFAPLPEDDDHVELQVKAAKNGASGKNFLSSLMSLQQ